jgi:hypothetical protein
MGTTRPVLYLDTCAIIEAYRVRCWLQLVDRYELHTVRKCREELESGNPRDPDYIHVDLQQIDAAMVIHTLAPKAMIITTGDRAAIVAACELGLRENLQPLEEVAATVGIRAEFQKHYRRAWLAEICTKCALGYI